MPYNKPLPGSDTLRTPEVVLAKARAAVEWCKHATEDAKNNGGKPWSYLLIPHDAITVGATLDRLAVSFRVMAL